MSSRGEMQACPECGGGCDRDSVDVGVGVLVGPWGCMNCGWSEDPEYSHPTAESGFDPLGGFDPVAAAVAKDLKAAGFHITSSTIDGPTDRLHYMVGGTNRPVESLRVTLSPKVSPFVCSNCFGPWGAGAEECLNGHEMAGNVGPLVNWDRFVDNINITRGEHRIWLVFHFAEETLANGQKACTMEFEACGDDPTAALWIEKCEVKRAEDNRKIAAEQLRLENERAHLPAPTLGHWISPGFIEFGPRPRTWLESMVDDIGWAQVLMQGFQWPVDDSQEEGPLDFLLREGITPNQPFLVRFSGFSSNYEHSTGECDPEWECEVIAHGPAPSFPLGEIETAWAYDNRIRIDRETHP